MSVISRVDNPGITYPVAMYQVGSSLLPDGASDGRVHAVYQHVPEAYRDPKTIMQIHERVNDTQIHQYVSKFGGLAVVRNLPPLNQGAVFGVIIRLWNMDWIERLVLDQQKPGEGSYRKVFSGTPAPVTALREISRLVPSLGSLQPQAI